MCERRVARSTRKTINERRVSGSNDRWVSESEPPRPQVTASTPTRRPETPVRSGLSEELIRLAHLCQAGLLTPEELESAKARTLAEFRISPATE